MQIPLPNIFVTWIQFFWSGDDWKLNRKYCSLPSYTLNAVMSNIFKVHMLKHQPNMLSIIFEPILNAIILHFDHVCEPHFCPSVDIQIPPACSSHCTVALAHWWGPLTGVLYFFGVLPQCKLPFCKIQLFYLVFKSVELNEI